MNKTDYQKALENKREKEKQLFVVQSVGKTTQMLLKCTIS